MCRRRLGESNLRGYVVEGASTNIVSASNTRRASSTNDCIEDGWQSMVTNANSYVRMDNITDVVDLPPTHAKICHLGQSRRSRSSCRSCEWLFGAKPQARRISHRLDIDEKS